MAVTNGITIDYSIDEVQLAQLMADGWTHIELFYSNTPEGPYATTSEREPLALGQYEYTLVYPAGNPGQSFVILLWDGTANSREQDSRRFPGGGGTTLARLRQLTGRMLHDMVEGTTTGSGSTTSAVCAQIAVTRFDDSHFMNWFFNRVTGTQEWTQVTASAKSTGTLTLSPAIASVGSGVGFELTRRWTPPEYREALNWAITAAYPTLSRQVVNTSLRTQAFGAEPIYTWRIPQDLRTIHVAEYEEASEVASSETGRDRGHPWRKFAFETIRDGTQRNIEIKVPLPDNRRIRLTGTGMLPTLYNDADYVDVEEPESLLICYLAAHRLYSLLPNDSASSDIDRYEAQAKYYYGLYEQHKAKFVPSKRPKSIWGHDARWSRRRP